MNADTLIRAVSQLEPLADHASYIRSIAKPSVDIELVEDPATPDCSRFGGHPFVPRDFQWPSHDIGEYRFLGQINFAEILQPPSSLPETGLLSIFYAFDVFWGDDRYILGFYWEDYEDHITMQSPADETPKTKRINLTTGLNLLSSRELRDDRPFDDEGVDCLCYELPEMIDPKGDYLLGYPSFCTLAYDPTPGPEWISLLTVRSLEEFGWCWHDGDKLMVFIEARRLADRDFSSLKSDAG